MIRIMDRLDKIISRELNMSRSNAREFIMKGAVTVNGSLVRKTDYKCSAQDEILAQGQPVFSRKFVYIMMNKPKGVISASDGKNEKTVVDILPDSMKRKGLFPAGRLDKDTTGFVLITDDGEFAHDILSPKHHVDKTYIAALDRPFDATVQADFEQGMTLNGEKLMQAELVCMNGDYSKARVVLKQGLYHQVKRMFKKHGITVTELHRIKIGSLCLDTNLDYGECRYLNADELNLIKNRQD